MTEIERVGGGMERMEVGDVIQQVAFIQHVMESVMKDGEHYGVIPGCGSKPALLKAGAEKLGMTFRLAPKFAVTERQLAGDHREYYVECSLTHIPTGQFVGQGVGMASSLESKWRFVGGQGEDTGNPVPPSYWELRKLDPAKARESIGGAGYSTKKIGGEWRIVRQVEKVERDNPADTFNTVLKMAKKRAHGDAILTATAASDIFAQDIEELDVAEVRAAEITHTNTKAGAIKIDMATAKSMVLPQGYDEMHTGKTVRDLVIHEPAFVHDFIEGDRNPALVTAFKMVRDAWIEYSREAGRVEAEDSIYI